nr:glycosyltransferase family 61 protein [Gluconobacter oxydans]
MKIKALLLKSNYDPRNSIPLFCNNYNIIEIDDLNESDKYPDVNTIITSLVLTHSENNDCANNFIEKVCKIFDTVIFFEPSSYSKSYLYAFGYKNYHENYSENKMFGKIDLDFFLNLNSIQNIYRIEHYGVNITYDARATWIVPMGCRGNVDFSEFNNRKNIIFDKIVFELSAFVLKGFNSLRKTLDDDLCLVELKTVQPLARAGGFFLEDFKRPNDLGTEIYKTPEDNSFFIAGTKIFEPKIIGDRNEYNDQKEQIYSMWGEKIKTSWKGISVYQLDECVIGYSGFIFCCGKPVYGSEYLLSFISPSLYQTIWEGMQKPHSDNVIPGIAIMGFNCLSYNYYHFVAEALNSVSLCLDICEEENISIITRKLNNYEREYFNFIIKDFNKIKVVELDHGEFVRADHLLYCNTLLGRAEYLQNWVLPDPSLILERIPFKEKILQKTGLSLLRQQEKLLYISRQDTKTRPILNEEELIKRLQAIGFDILVSTGMPIYDQIRIFREAKIVVAGHGAGVSNMLYAHPGTILVELIQASYLNIGPMRLSQIAGCQYYSILSFKDGDNDGWYVDIENVENKIKEFL